MKVPLKAALASAAAVFVLTGAAQAQGVRLQLGSAKADVKPITSSSVNGVRLWKGRAPAQEPALLGAEPPTRIVHEHDVRVIVVHKSRLKRLRTQGFYAGHLGCSRRFTQGFYSGPVDWAGDC
jgi:hypothetical protein